MTEYFDEAAAMRNVTERATVEQLRATILAVIDAAEAGGYIDGDVRDLKHILWTGLTTNPPGQADAPAPKPGPERHGVVGKLVPASTGRTAVGFLQAVEVLKAAGRELADG